MPAPRILPEVEILIMDQSSSQPLNGNSAATDAKDASSQRLVADQLLAALASGNLENLAHARQAFVKDDVTEVKQFPNDVEVQLERGSISRSTEDPVVSEDDLREEEEALKKAELEVERRRAEVKAA
jgi:hypothetical protein